MSDTTQQNGKEVKREMGRPQAIDENVLRKLEDAFFRGLTDEMACFQADISPSTLYKFCQENPDFAERKEALKQQVKARARLNISEAIEAKNLPLSQWYLERKDREFNEKKEVDVTTKGEKISMPSLALIEEFEEKLKKQITE